MKKGLKGLFFALLLTMVLHVTGIAAQTIYVIVGFELPAWRGDAEIATLTKTNDNQEKLTLASYFDINLQARIVANDGYYPGDSGFAWSITINNNDYATIYPGSDGYSGASAYAYFAGSKTLHLRTSAYWASTTTANGTWYVNGS